jgi:hypothetical protein
VFDSRQIVWSAECRVPSAENHRTANLEP